MKAWNLTDNTSQADKALHRDGRSAAQVTAAVRAPSRKAAVALFRGWSDHAAKGYWFEGVSSEMAKYLDMVPPGVVIIKPLDPGGTIHGHKGWVRRDTYEPLIDQETERA